MGKSEKLISWDEQPPLLTKALPCNLRERPRRKRPRLPAGAPAPTGGQLNGEVRLVEVLTSGWDRIASHSSSALT